MIADLVGHCPHVWETVAGVDLDLRETGWLFARRTHNKAIAPLVIRVQFGKVAAIHMGSFNATVCGINLRPDISLEQLAVRTQDNLEIADFVASDHEVAARFLSRDLELAEGNWHAGWTAQKLARLLQAGRIFGSFEVPEPEGTRPVL